MPSTRNFTVFQDEDAQLLMAPNASSETQVTKTKSKIKVDTENGADRVFNLLADAKENINPLTGSVFDPRPPLKKRKAAASSASKFPLSSSSSALKAKHLSSSSKPTHGSKRPSGGKDKDKTKRRALSMRENEGGRAAAIVDPVIDGSTPSLDTEAEQLLTALGNRNAYALTVMPLADVTCAYEGAELTHVVLAVDEGGRKDTLNEGKETQAQTQPHLAMGKIFPALSEEIYVGMHNTPEETATFC